MQRKGKTFQLVTAGQCELLGVCMFLTSGSSVVSDSIEVHYRVCATFF